MLYYRLHIPPYRIFQDISQHSVISKEYGNIHDILYTRGIQQNSSCSRYGVTSLTLNIP